VNMEVVVACCAGLDVRQASVVACLNQTAPNGRSRKQVRSFGTMRGDLAALRDWLAQAGRSRLAMESTGVYWQPVYDMLEDHAAVTSPMPSTSRPCPGARPT
jgi:transposase